MAKNRCEIHGSFYAGDHCAFCEQQRLISEQAESIKTEIQEASVEIKDALETDRIERELADAELASEFRETTANAWKIQSVAKSEQALSLYKAGVYPAALHLTRQALEQDPANIEAVHVAAKCLQADNRIADAKQYFERQIALLRTEEFAGSPKYFAWTFDCLPDDSALLETFSKTLQKMIGLWRLGSDKRTIICMTDCLIRRNRLDDAFTIEQWLIAIGIPSLEILAVIRVLIGKLLASQQDSKANILFESLVKRARSLADYGCLLDLGRLLGIDLVQQLESFLEVQKIEDRKTVESDLSALQKGAGQEGLSQEAFTQIMDLLSRRYMQWQPALLSRISNEAMVKAKSQRISGYGCLATIVAYILLFFSTVYVGEVFFRSPPISIARGFLGVAAAAIVIGILSAHLIKRIKLRRNAVKFENAAIATENNSFQRLGLPILPPKPSSLWSLVDSALAATIILVFCISIWWILSG